MKILTVYIYAIMEKSMKFEYVLNHAASCIAYQYYVLQLWILSLAFKYNRNLYLIYSTIEWKREINHWPSSPVELASRLIIINIIINVVVSQSEILYIYFTDGNPWQSDKFTKEILKGYCFEFFHQIKQCFRWSVSFTTHKNPVINCYGCTALWFILFQSVSSHSFFMSFKQLLWGNRSSVCNCWRYSFWIFFQTHVCLSARHLLSGDENIWPWVWECRQNPCPLWLSVCSTLLCAGWI